MNEFLRAIPAAATSPYALAAYAIAAVLFLLAGAHLKTVRSVLKAISNVPPSDRRGLIESITGSVIPEKITANEWIRNNRNRWIFLLVATTIILFSTIGIIALYQPSIEPGPQPTEESARAEANAWLRKTDSGDIDGAYAAMFNGFRKNHSQDEWLERFAMYRSPLGKVESRKIASSTPSQSIADGVPLNFYQYMYFTKYENLTTPIREVVQLASPGLPEPWRVAGYFIDVPPDAPFLNKPKQSTYPR